MAEHQPNPDETTDDGYYTIDPEGPNAEDLARAAERDAAEGIEPASDQPAADTGDVLARVLGERDELQQQLLRVSADYQNFAKRSQQNIAAAGEQKLMDMARALVSVLDHFDRALEAAGTESDDTAPGGSSGGGDLLRGVTMVNNELLTTLGRFGIERMEVSPGDEFDPVRHEALMRQPSDDIASSHITMQLLPGYTLGDKIVRPAQVGVAE